MPAKTMNAPANLPTLAAAPSTDSKPLIGFIGQGFIGKNYADDLERRGYSTVRYSLEPEHIGNKEYIRACDIVFIAVPTPTTPKGFSSLVVEEALTLVGLGKIAVIKSTIVPGTAARLRRLFPAATLLYSPEFLSEKTAAYDAAHPFANIMGLSVDDERYQAAARLVLSILPQAPFELICTSTEAELIKYSHNLNGYFQILLSNVLYDAAQTLGAEWAPIEEALRHDPLISNRYVKPVHQSGYPGAKPGRGAGGHCFIKDFAAFRQLYATVRPGDATGLAVLTALEEKNIALLKESGKDLDLLEEVYGSEAPAPVAQPAEHLMPSLGALDRVLIGAGAMVMLLGVVDLGTILTGILR